MADQYGRDTAPLAGAGGGSPYQNITEEDLRRRIAEVQAQGGGASAQQQQLEAIGNRYPEMGTDLQMMMQGVHNDMSGASLDPSVGGAGAAGLEQSIQQAIEQSMNQGQDLNMFQRILQNASVMPGLTGTPEGAGILSLLLGVTNTPLGTRGVGQGSQLAGLGRLLSAYAQMGKLRVAQQNQAADAATMAKVAQAHKDAGQYGGLVGDLQLLPGETIKARNWQYTAPGYSPEVNFAAEGARRQFEQQNRGAGTAGAPAGQVVLGTGPSPIFDASAIGTARANGQPMPGPVGETPMQFMDNTANLAAHQVENKARATAAGTAAGQGDAQTRGDQPLPPAAQERLVAIDQGVALLDQLERMYVGTTDANGRTTKPLVPGVEADMNDPLSGGKILMQGLVNGHAYLQGDPKVEASEKTRKGLATLIARGYGEKGNVSDADVARAMLDIPSMWEGLGTRRAKLAILRNVQERTRESILALQGRIPGVPGGGRALANPTARRLTVEAVP